MSIVKLAFAFVLALSFSTPGIAQSDIEGVIIGTDAVNGTITVRNEATGKRRTYFVGSETRISAEGGTVDISMLQKGQNVKLRFDNTDRGREILELDVPSLSELGDMATVQSDQEYQVSGVITGVRPSKRTVTIRPDNGESRITLRVPKETVIRRKGKSVPLSRMAKGDEVTFRYRETEQGLVIFTARAPERVAEAKPEETYAQNLPTTADNRYTLLIAAMALLSGGLFVSYFRRHRQL